MKKLFKKFSSIIALFAIALGIAISPIDVEVANAANCDANAVIYCGITSPDNLKTKLESGTGKQYQSASELKISIFSWRFLMAVSLD